MFLNCNVICVGLYNAWRHEGIRKECRREIVLIIKWVTLRAALALCTLYSTTVYNATSGARVTALLASRRLERELGSRVICRRDILCLHLAGPVWRRAAQRRSGVRLRVRLASADACRFEESESARLHPQRGAKRREERIREERIRAFITYIFACSYSNAYCNYTFLLP